MTARATGRTVALIAMLVAGLCLALFFLYREQATNTKAVTAAPAASKSASKSESSSASSSASKSDSKSAAATSTPALPKAKSDVSVLIDKLASPLPAAEDSNVPAFDLARVEPTGEAVIAGRAAPGSTVELLRNGEVHDRAVVDRSGQFAMVPPRLPSGSYELTLRMMRPDGTQTTSKQSVAVLLEAKPTSSEPPVVALITPEKPTVVLSQPAAPTPATPTVVVEAADIEPDGKLHVSGRAAAGAAVRFYLNETFVAAVTAAADGRFSITVNEGVVPGNYRIRLDQVEPGSGSVRARAEVPLNVPVATASRPMPAAPAKQTEVKPAEVKQAEVKQAEAKPAEAKPAEVKPAEVKPPPASTQPSAVVVGKPAAASSAPALAAAATPPAAPSSGTPSPATPPPAIVAQQPSAAGAAPRGTSPSAVVVPKIETAKVVRGDNLWNISRNTYGAGPRYAVIYRANRDQIRNPNLIYPGQVFVLPAK